MRGGDRLELLTPGRFLSAPGLWLGLAFAAACLAMARHAAANASPSHRPGALRNRPGVSSSSRSPPRIAAPPKPSAIAPMTRYRISDTKCELPNASRSTSAIANGGNTAQSTGIRRAHADTSSSQP
jgi:hypothetical protein